MNKLRVMTVVGTRPEIIRLSRVLTKLDNSEAIDHISVHTGQNYDFELNEIFYSDLGLNVPKFKLSCAGGNPAETVGRILVEVNKLIESEKPHAFLILGDTNSCLSAIIAKKHKIPIFHMEAGNRCFSELVPEETNRKIVDHIADINLTYSSIAREYLISEGISPDRIIKTGSPMKEVLDHYSNKINSSTILKKLNLVSGNYFVVSFHREENVTDDNLLKNFLNTLNEISSIYRMPIIFSAHPRTKKSIEDSGIALKREIRIMSPFGFSDYIQLQKNSFIVLSDSGTISEESSLLNFRALNIRKNHERPEAMEEASVIMTGLSRDRILQSISVISSQNIGAKRDLSIVMDYDKNNVAEKVIRILLSYADYVSYKKI